MIWIVLHQDNKQFLIRADEMLAVAVGYGGSGSQIDMKNGESYGVDESVQTVKNRLRLAD